MEVPGPPLTQIEAMPAAVTVADPLPGRRPSRKTCDVPEASTVAEATDPLTEMVLILLMEKER